jgi:hypothetical protein
MATENDYTPYISREAGDLWTAGDWNEVQEMIKKDIRDQIATATEEITRDGVDRADNADKFDNKTPTDWTDDLDERYAPKLHDHEGQNVYRRYFKRFTADTPEAFLHHELGRFPLVDIYGLWPVSDEVTTSTEVESSDGSPAKFFLYYHHEEADKFGLDVRVYRERVPLGIPIAKFLDEYGVGWNEENKLEDVRNELWKKLLASPNDEISHASSPWIEERIIERSKIGDFMEGSEGGEWPDIRLAFRPQKMEVVVMPFVLAEAQPVERAAAPVEGVIPEFATVPVTHVNYDTLLLEIQVLLGTGELPEDALLDVMLLLRI